ncbi:unnamed protein product [Brachionus calyciflorus]|uniref:GrpE protein homolog n=1 Tax=Brachionus calyciflorus TaxID=104777 RepID=A0A813M1L7_9BILA|nr:unnamed protein product [Brachionus calyciflorus]
MLVKISRNILSSNRINLVATLNKYTTESSTQTQDKNEQKLDETSQKLDVELKALKEKLTKTEEEKLDLKDKYLRAMAEAENVRVRMRKQVDDAKLFGIQGFCKDLLEVADILNLAIVNTDPKKDKTLENIDKNVVDKLTSMHQGLIMTEGRLLKIFEKHGLVQIKPTAGDKFDPNLHEAIFRVPIPNKESGSIEIVSKIGFKLHERVIRAAQVGVVQ